VRQSTWEELTVCEEKGEGSATQRKKDPENATLKREGFGSELVKSSRRMTKKRKCCGTGKRKGGSCIGVERRTHLALTWRNQIPHDKMSKIVAGREGVRGESAWRKRQYSYRKSRKQVLGRGVRVGKAPGISTSRHSIHSKAIPKSPVRGRNRTVPRQLKKKRKRPRTLAVSEKLSS